MPISARSALTAAASAGLLFVLAACGGVGGTPAAGNAAAAAGNTTAPTTKTSTSTPTSTRTATPTSSTTETDLTLASGVTIEELKDDIDGAQTVVDGFWTQHWADYFTGDYVAPTVVGLYDGTDEDTAPECDGEALEAYNAFYCPDGDFVAWDASLLVDGADQIGDSWVFLVVAHEWGHAIQARLDGTLVAQADELQADCLGAAALYGAAADGTLTFDLGDEQELVTSLSALADQMPWTMTSDHGDAFQRVQWFTLGRNGGVNACIDVLEDPSASTVPSTIDVSPTSVPSADVPPPTGGGSAPTG
jgi:predicted metalloprotease